MGKRAQTAHMSHILTMREKSRNRFTFELDSFVFPLAEILSCGGAGLNSAVHNGNDVLNQGNFGNFL